MTQPKANFKHSLPQHYSAEYFTDIRKKLSESIAEQMQRAKAQKLCVGCYDGEEIAVGLDMMEACRMLESAPLDYWEQRWLMSGRRSNSSRRPDSATSRSSSQHLAPLQPSSRPPRAATPTTPKTPLVSLAEGRTSDGLYGLNHHPPQKDQYNGPCQAFLENDAESFGKTSVWQSWGEARNQFFEEGANIAAQVFTFACVDETIVAVSPSTPPTDGSGSRQSSSTPFRRSPRPDYEARLAELQSYYVKFGASSWLHFEKALLVHVWRCETSARRFAHGWQRCWQSIFEHRIRGIHCPLSVMYHMQGITLSVTALPPVYIDKVPPLTNVFTPFFSPNFDLHRRVAKVPRQKDGKGVRSQALGHMVARLFAVLHIPQDDTILDEFGDCNLYAGVDGRWYMLQLGPVLAHSTPHLSRIGGTGGVPVRHELLRQVVMDSHPTSGGLPHSFQVTDLSNKGLHKYLLQVAIPKAMANAVALLPMGTASSRRSEALVRDAFLPMMLHDHGVNMGYLYYVYQHCLRQSTSLSPLDHDVGEEGLVAGVSFREAQDLKRGTPGSRARSRVEEAENENAAQTSPAALYALLARTCVMEMMTRTIKHLVRLDCIGGFCTAWKTSTTVRLDMVNRVARLSASRDTDFLVAHVIPALRSKFRCGEDFLVGWDSVPIGTLLKVLSLKLGVEYGVAEGRFNVFAPFAKKRGVLMVPLVAIDALLAQDQPRMHDGVGQLWADANRIAGRQPSEHAMLVASQAPAVLSTLHAAFLVRAMTFSIATRMHRSLVWTYKPLDSALAKKSSAWPSILIADVLEHVAAAEITRCGDTDAPDSDAVVAFDNSRSQIEVRPLIGPRFDEYRHMLKDFLREDRAQHGGNHDDIPLWTLRLIHCANVLMRADRPEAASVLRLCIEELLSVPHVDFVFSAMPSQALKRLESKYATLDAHNVTHALGGLVETVVGSLRRWNRLSNAARYVQRVTASMLNHPAMESSPLSPRVAHLSVQLSTTVYGPHDPKTAFAVYLMALFGLAHASAHKSLSASTQRSVEAQIINLRKIIRKHGTLLPPMQLAFNKTQAVHSLLEKLVSVLVECGDELAVPTLQSAVYHSERYRSAIVLLQAVGRGYTRRLLVASSKGPFAMPKRQSSLTYYDGEVPIALGQAGNLGISLEDESTREWRGRPQQGATQQDNSSDVNSVTGSFASSSTYSSSRPPRFSRTVAQSKNSTADLPKPTPRPVPSEPPMSVEPSYTLRRKARPPSLPQNAIPTSLLQTVEAHQQQRDQRLPAEPHHDSPCSTVASTPGVTPGPPAMMGSPECSGPPKGAVRTPVEPPKPTTNAWDFAAPYSPNIPPVGATSDDEDAPAPPLTLSHSTQVVPVISQSTIDLFGMCDTDEDGVATVQECVDVVSRLHVIGRDELTQVFASVSTKQKRGGLTSLFSRAKDVLSINDFHVALGILFQ